MSKVLKFGGSSMANIGNVVKTILYNREQNSDEGLGIVVSAVGKTTNNLQAMINNPDRIQEYKDKIIEEHKESNKTLSDNSLTEEEMSGFIDTVINPYLNKAEEIIKNNGITEKEKAEINSFGERISYKFLQSCLEKSDVESERLNSGKLVHTRGEKSLDGDCEFKETEKACKKFLKPKLDEGKVVCITGYYGTDASGDVATLGRNASDTIAAIIGTCCDAEEVIIYTDVDGIYSDNPNAGHEHKIEKLEKVRIPEMYQAAKIGGASVLHYKVVDFLIKMQEEGHSISKISIKDTRNPEGEGTPIVEELVEGVKFVIDDGVQSKIEVSSLQDEDKPGFAAKIAEVYSNYDVSSDVVSSLKNSVSHTISEISQDNFAKNEKYIIKDLGKIGKVKKVDNLHKVVVIGTGKISKANTLKCSSSMAPYLNEISLTTIDNKDGFVCIVLIDPSRGNPRKVISSYANLVNNDNYQL